MLKFEHNDLTKQREHYIQPQALQPENLEVDALTVGMRREYGLLGADHL
jgi:hypothetical protein